MGQSYDLEMQRRSAEQEEAYGIRQDALRSGNFEAWRLARLLRDASTADQAEAVKQRLAQLRRFS